MTAGNQMFNDLWKFDGSNWTWVSGSNEIDQKGVYGTKSAAAPGNIPGARALGVSWTDKQGNLWLFGGFGYDSAGQCDGLNDLWKFDGSNWTWVSGSDKVDRLGVYGTKGEADTRERPGSAHWLCLLDRSARQPLALRRRRLRFGRERRRLQRPVEIRRDELDLGLRQQYGRVGGSYGKERHGGSGKCAGGAGQRRFLDR